MAQSERPALVAVRLEGNGDLVDMVAAIWAAGDAVLPVDVRLPGREIERILALTKPRYLVSGGGRVELGDWAPLSPGTVAVLLTSGSTGEPKPVELSRDAAMASARAVHDRLGVGAGDKWLCCLPLSHVAGFAMLVRSALLGNHPIIRENFDAAATRTDATLVSLVPTQLERALGEGSDLTGFKAILLGGAAIPTRLVERAREAGANVVRTYGMTETFGGVVYEGRPLDGVQVRTDPDGAIEISSPTLMTRYVGLDELSAERLRDGWFTTDDLGHLDNGILVVDGRKDDVIVTGAEKVVPREVESALTEHPLVAEAVVFGVPDTEWGERVVGVVVPREAPEVPTSDELRAFLKERLARHKIPKEIVLTAAIPRLESGKADVGSLKRLLDLT